MGLYRRSCPDMEKAFMSVFYWSNCSPINFSKLTENLTGLTGMTSTPNFPVSQSTLEGFPHREALTGMCIAVNLCSLRSTTSFHIL